MNKYIFYKKNLKKDCFCIIYSSKKNIFFAKKTKKV